MVGESLFGTIRFGESPETAVSPVLLSGTSAAVTAVGAAGSAVRIGKEVSAQQKMPSSGRAHVLRTGGISSPDSREEFSSGSAVGAGRKLGAWNDTPGTCRAAAEIGRSPASSQGTIPWAAIRPERTAATTSAGETLTASSGAAIASLRELRGPGNREEMKGAVLPDVFRLLASGERVQTAGEIRFRIPAALSAACHACTVSVIALPFPGLVVWSIQEGASTAVPETVRRLASDTPTPPGFIRTSLHVPTALCCTSWSWVRAEGLVRGAGLLILNRQGTGAQGKTRVERRIGSRGGERTTTDPMRVRIVRELAGNGWGRAGGRNRVIGTALLLQNLQGATVQGELPIGRRVEGRERSGIREKIDARSLRNLESRAGEREGALQSISVLLYLLGYGGQTETGRAVAGRIRAVGTIEREAPEFFGRFAVVPDLRNDRVVVVFAEVRSVVIPRQSDL